MTTVNNNRPYTEYTQPSRPVRTDGMSTREPQQHTVVSPRIPSVMPTTVSPAFGPDSRPQGPSHPRTMSPRVKQSRKVSPWLYIMGLMIGGFVLFGAAMSLVVIGFLAQPRVPDGVTVAGIAIGGETLDDAALKLGQFAAQPLTVTDGSREWQITMDDLGASLNAEALLENIQDVPRNTAAAPVISVDLEKAQDGLVRLSEQVNIEAISGNPPVNGAAIEIPVVLSRLRADATRELADGRLELNMIEVIGEFIEDAPYTGEPVTHIVEPGQELGLIAKMYDVSVQEIVKLNEITNPDLLFVGQELRIPAPSLYVPTGADAPPAPVGRGKAIIVSTTNQRIYAYEDGVLVRSHLVSTGRSETPTVLGDYRIYVKYVADDMSGPDYFLPQVPYTMYFYQGYGIHGTYWHNSFGRPMSHGCVNLPIDEARWFFEWAEEGTLVRVI